MEENKKNKLELLVYLIVFIVVEVVSCFYSESITLGLIGGFLITMLFILFDISGIIGNIITKKDEVEKQKRLKEYLKSFKTEELKESMNEFDIIQKALNKEYNKRKDRNFKDILMEEFNWICIGGFVILLLGLFYLGAMPTYFNVNNELLNPSNESIGLNHSMTLIKNVVVNTLMEKVINEGSENSLIFFWSWWVAIIIFFIYPIVKLVYYMIIKIKHGGI